MQVRQMTALKHIITALVVLTVPLWLIPFCVFMILALLYGEIHDSLWRRGPRYGDHPGPP